MVVVVFFLWAIWRVAGERPGGGGTGPLGPVDEGSFEEDAKNTESCHCRDASS